MSFAPLQSVGSIARVGGFRPSLLGFVAESAHHRRHCCRSVARSPYLPAPPSTSSPASTPATTLLPRLRSRGANLPITFRPHRFARSRRFAPPIAPLARDSAPSLAQDSRACCIPLPILGFAAFLASFGWFRHPTRAIFPGFWPAKEWSVCSRSREIRVLAALFIPFGGFPPSAAASCLHDRCLRGVRFPRSLDRFVAPVAGFVVRVWTA